MQAHERVVEMSLRLHTAVARRLLAAPELVKRARERVTVWLEAGTVARDYAVAWQQLLAEPLPRLIEALEERSERMHDLRQVSPFAGALDARTRWQVRRAAAG